MPSAPRPGTQPSSCIVLDGIASADFDAVRFRADHKLDDEYISLQRGQRVLKELGVEEQGWARGVVVSGNGEVRGWFPAKFWVSLEQRELSELKQLREEQLQCHEFQEQEIQKLRMEASGARQLRQQDLRRHHQDCACLCKELEAEKDTARKLIQQEHRRQCSQRQTEHEFQEELENTTRETESLRRQELACENALQKLQEQQCQQSRDLRRLQNESLKLRQQELWQHSMRHKYHEQCLQFEAQAWEDENLRREVVQELQASQDLTEGCKYLETSIAEHRAANNRLVRLEASALAEVQETRKERDELTQSLENVQSANTGLEHRNSMLQDALHCTNASEAECKLNLNHLSECELSFSHQVRDLQGEMQEVRDSSKHELQSCCRKYCHLFESEASSYRQWMQDAELKLKMDFGQRARMDVGEVWYEGEEASPSLDDLQMLGRSEGLFRSAAHDLEVFAEQMLSMECDAVIPTAPSTSDATRCHAHSCEQHEALPFLQAMVVQAKASRAGMAREAVPEEQQKEDAYRDGVDEARTSSTRQHQADAKSSIQCGAMPKEKFLFLVRHARSEWNDVINQPGISHLQSLFHTDHQITADGIRQARTLYQAISEEHSKCINERAAMSQKFYDAFFANPKGALYCSPMLRALQTAQLALPTEMGWQQIKLLQDAREIRQSIMERDNVGEVCGNDIVHQAKDACNSISYATQSWKQVDTSECMQQWWSDQPETEEDVNKRLHSLRSQLLDADDSPSCVCVTHSNIIRRFMMRFGGVDVAEMGAESSFMQVDCECGIMQRSKRDKLCNCGVIGLRMQYECREWTVKEVCLMFDSILEGDAFASTCETRE